jgi:DNA-binding winged helix-turn-helix (wHTH) protein/Tol biopolymer transport system component
MDSLPGPSRSIRFGVFEFDRQARQLMKRGSPVRLQDQPALVLAALTEDAGQIVSRDELRRRLWPDGTSVEYEQSINKAVNKLRDVLGDSADRPMYIETVPRRGYRFVAPVETAEARPPAPKVHVTSVKRVRRTLVLAGAAVVLVTMVLTTGLWPARIPRVERVVQITNDATQKLPPLISDGSNIIYGDETSLWSVPVSGGQPKRLTLPFLSQPTSWVFVCGYSPRQRKILVISPGAGANQLWLTGPEGDAATRVGEVPMNASAAISPDGERLVIGTRDGIYVQSISTGQRRKIRAMTWNGARGVWWHPSGTIIGFDDQPGVRARPRPWQVDDSGTNARPIVGTDPPVVAGVWSTGVASSARVRSWTTHHPVGTGVWSMDGRRFFFYRLEDEMHVQLIPGMSGWMRGPAIAQLTTSGQFVSPPAVDPMNPKRLYTIGSMLRGETVRYDRRRRMWVPLLPGFSGESVARSPDGQWLAYITFPDAELHKCRADGSGDIVLAPGTFAANPQWSPDGKRIAFAGIQRGLIGELKLWLVSSGGGDAAEYRPEIANPFDTIWSRDGRRLLLGQPRVKVAAGESRIKILNVETGTVEQVPGGEYLFSAHWSPDEQRLMALHISKQTVHLYNATQRRWLELADIPINYPTWSADGKSVYGLYQQGRMIVRIDADARQREDILKIDFPIVGNIAPWLGWTEQWEPIVVRDLSSTQIFRIELDR